MSAQLRQLAAVAETPGAVREDDAGAQGLRAHFEHLDVPGLRSQFAAQGSFVALSDFLPPEMTARLLAAVEELRAVYERFTEGFDTVDARTARELLGDR